MLQSQTRSSPRTRSRSPLALLVTALVLAVAGGGAADAYAVSGKVDGYKHGKRVLQVKKKGGKVVKVATASKVKVKLVPRKGKAFAGDVNDIVPGAKVLETAREGRKIAVIELRALASGSSDCSFDMVEAADDEGESFDCSTSYEAEKESCSFDESRDGGSGDVSEDTSWDCSYEDDELSWDCSFDSSQSASTGPDGGDSDADFSFDCSWESEKELSGPLWECNLDAAVLGFGCSSELLDQEFGAKIDTSGLGVSLDSFVDFSKDYVKDGESETVDCSKTADALDCSFDGEGEAGDCELDFSFDRSHEPGYVEGDVSGDGSMSCSYDADDDDQHNDGGEEDAPADDEV